MTYERFFHCRLHSSLLWKLHAYSCNWLDFLILRLTVHLADSGAVRLEMPEFPCTRREVATKLGTSSARKGKLVAVGCWLLSMLGESSRNLCTKNIREKVSTISIWKRLIAAWICGARNTSPCQGHKCTCIRIYSSRLVVSTSTFSNNSDTLIKEMGSPERNFEICVEKTMHDRSCWLGSSFRGDWSRKSVKHVVSVKKCVGSETQTKWTSSPTQYLLSHPSKSFSIAATNNKSRPRVRLFWSTEQIISMVDGGQNSTTEHISVTYDRRMSKRKGSLEEKRERFWIPFFLKSAGI